MDFLSSVLFILIPFTVIFVPHFLELQQKRSIRRESEIDTRYRLLGSNHLRSPLSRVWLTAMGFTIIALGSQKELVQFWSDVFSYTTYSEPQFFIDGLLILGLVEFLVWLIVTANQITDFREKIKYQVEEVLPKNIQPLKEQIKDTNVSIKNDCLALNGSAPIPGAVHARIHGCTNDAGLSSACRNAYCVQWSESDVKSVFSLHVEKDAVSGDQKKRLEEDLRLKLNYPLLGFGLAFIALNILIIQKKAWLYQLIKALIID